MCSAADTWWRILSVSFSKDRFVTIAFSRHSTKLSWALHQTGFAIGELCWAIRKNWICVLFFLRINSPCLLPLLAFDGGSSVRPRQPGLGWTGTLTHNLHFYWQGALRLMFVCVAGSAAVGGWRIQAWWWGVRPEPQYPGCQRPYRDGASPPAGCCLGCSGSAGGRKEDHPPGTTNSRM